jgi:natural product precursor
MKTSGDAENRKAVTTAYRVGQTKNNNTMKTLGKLKLNEEKMLSSEELLGFRGGSGSGCTTYVWYVCRSNYMAAYTDCFNNCGGFNCNFIWVDC